MEKTVLPVISVITPTFNRENELPFLVQSIQNQTLDHSLFEMIIVDDGSTDNTESLIPSILENIDFNLKYLTKNNQGPGAARNHGIDNSRGDLILFIDSDCEADERWMEVIYDEYLNNRYDACGGPDAAKKDFTPLQKAIDYSMTSFITTGGMRGHSTKMIAKFYPRSHNMGVTKTLIKQVGGFGSLRHGQDIELSHRIRKSGAKIRFIPNAVVYHRRRTSLRSFFKQTFNWGVARINLYKIDKSLLEPIHFFPSIGLISVITILVGCILANLFFLYIMKIGLILFLIQCILGMIKHKDIRVFGFLLLVIPTQIFGYGTGFLFAFVKRVIFNFDTFIGFEKKYYSN